MKNHLETSFRVFFGGADALICITFGSETNTVLDTVTVVLKIPDSSLCLLESYSSCVCS